MVLRAKRAKNGRMMYFKDNKLISKARYQAAKGRTNRTRKRSPARKPSKNGVKRMKRTLPHPSVTGMASGLAIAAYLNNASTTGTAGARARAEGVIKDVTDGELGKAFSTLSGNAIDMITTNTGRKTLVTASGIALVGAFARRQFPQLKLGGQKLFFRI